ncbi:MAG TPA: hypothetical protein VGO47_07115 [Chlamydiales bacterium]|nr:hypothetical protein [Chlamydiales bacterium]
MDELVRTLTALQEQVMRMQERHDEAFKVLNEQGFTGIRTDPPQGETHPTNTHPTRENTGTRQESRSGPKPAAPSDFSGDRTKGRAFLNSVRWYMHSCGHEFRDPGHMIAWTLSFMKEGRALTFANQVTRQTEKQGHVPYATWADFWKELETRLLPIDESEEAINMLETEHYYQGKQTVDDYCDKFQDLVDQAGYTEGRQVVVKFRKGLETEIVDKVSLLQERRPKDDDIERWIDLAKEVARQRTRNELFNQAVRKDKLTQKATPPVITPTPAKVTGTSFFRPLPPMPRPSVAFTLRPIIPPARPAPTFAPPPVTPKPPVTGPIPMEVDAYKS